MSERPEDNSRSRSGDRRRGGPLGEDVDQSAQTRRDSGEDATQQIPTDDATRQIPTSERGGPRDRGGRQPSNDTQEFESPARPAGAGAGAGEPTRRTRLLGRGQDTGGYYARQQQASSPTGSHSTGYNDVLRDREEYLRDIYGGVDWLASFVGFIFTLLFAAIAGTAAGALLLVPLGLADSLSGGQLTSTAITGFAVVAGVLFVSFLMGGYISGRMARFDGGVNGAMVLLWTVLVAVALILLSGLLRQVISGTIAGQVVSQAFSFGNTATQLLGGLGTAGAVIGGAAALVALLGGMVGGRLGSRYHREIDYTP